MVKADLGQRAGKAAAEVFGRSWGAYWALVAFAGILAGYLGYAIGGWWYRVRLEWSGAENPDKHLARAVWVYQSLVDAIPALLLVIGYTFGHANYQEAWNAETWWGLLLMLFVAWSCVTSYVGATTAFTISRARAAVWFLALPLVFYTIALGVLGVLYALFAKGS